MNTPVPVKFRLLRRDEKLALFEAWLEGKTILASKDGAGWDHITRPGTVAWKDHHHYRLQPDPLKRCPFGNRTTIHRVEEDVQSGNVRCKEHTQWVPRKDWQERG